MEFEVRGVRFRLCGISCEDGIWMCCIKNIATREFKDIEFDKVEQFFKPLL